MASWVDPELNLLGQAIEGYYIISRIPTIEDLRSFLDGRLEKDKYVNLKTSWKNEVQAFYRLLLDYNKERCVANFHIHLDKGQLYFFCSVYPPRDF